MSVQKTVKQTVDQLLAKEMDRKEFLKHVGVSIAMLTGVTALVNSLLHQKQSILSQPKQYGYGSMPYGGLKNTK